MRCGIIPTPYLEHAAEHGDEVQKLKARRAIILSERARGRRERAQPLFEPEHGEQRAIHDAQHQETTEGPLVRAEDSPETDDPAATVTYDQMGEAYEYLHAVHQRAGYDGASGRMKASIHYGQDYDNAYWDGDELALGDGSIFPEFWKAPMVAYHELGHGFTQYTANLQYRNEPGGNNEAGSDIIAALTKMWRLGLASAAFDWLLAPELFSEGLQGRALRDMLHPGTAFNDPVLGKDGQIATADDYTPGMDVHFSSGVPNRWFAESCIQAGGNAWETVGRVWYDAWTTRMGPTSDFSAMAGATVASAEALFGAQSPIASAVRYGWDVVKVPIGQAPDPTPSPSPCGPADLMALTWAILGNADLRRGAVALAKSRAFRRLIARVRSQ